MHVSLGLLSALPPMHAWVRGTSKLDVQQTNLRLLVSRNVACSSLVGQKRASVRHQPHYWDFQGSLFLFTPTDYLQPATL